MIPISSPTNDDFRQSKLPTELNFLSDSSLNNALMAVAQEVAKLLQQTYPSQADGSNSIETSVIRAVKPENHRNRRLTHTQLQQLLDYIDTHLDRDLSLIELASVINISPTYFASLFKHSMGISPYQYVIQQRVEKAKLMLLKTDLAIADIAFQTGFSSQSHLTQQFKRLTGMTPKQIR